MFEWISSFFGSVGGFFHHAYDVVHDKVVDVYNGASNIVNNVVQAPITVVKTVYSDVKGLVSGVGSTVNHVVDKAHETIQKVVINGEDKLSNSVNSLGQSFSLSLVLLGGAGILFMLNKK